MTTRSSVKRASKRTRTSHGSTTTSPPSANSNGRPKRQKFTTVERARSQEAKELRHEFRTLRVRMKRQFREWAYYRAVVQQAVLRRCEMARIYAEAHPQYAQLDEAEVRRAANEGVAFDPTLSRLQIIERDQGVCFLCGEFIDLTAEHSDPLSVVFYHVVSIQEGGEHTADNIRLTHRNCRDVKTARRMIQTRQAKSESAP